MAVVSTGLTEVALRAEFSQAFDDTTTYHQMLATPIPSTRDLEEYALAGQVPTMREWGTGRLAKGLNIQEKYQVRNLEYEATLEVDRKELADDQTGILRVRIQELAQHAATHPDYLIAQLLNNGGSAGYLASDGQIFFSAAHVFGDSGTQDNDLAPSATSPSAPTVSEFKTAVQAALSAMMGFKGDTGESLRIAPTGIKLVVPANMYWTALEALNADVISSTSNALKGAAEVVPLADLSATDTFFTLKCDKPLRPFIYQQREAVALTSIAEGSEHEFKTNKHLYGVRGRYALTYGAWQCAVRSVFA